MQSVVKTAGAATEFETSERCFILELVHAADDPHISIARARVQPGVTTEWHALRDTDERYIITSGTGLMEVGGHAPTRVGPHDVVVIPRNTPQRITNTGLDDLIFYCICTPRFQPECYRALPTLEHASHPPT